MFLNGGLSLSGTNPLQVRSYDQPGLGAGRLAARSTPPVASRGNPANPLLALVRTETQQTGQDIQEANDAISKYQTADTSLDTALGYVEGMRELLDEALTEDLTDQERQALNEEYHRIGGGLSDFMRDSAYGDAKLFIGDGALARFSLRNVLAIDVTDLNDRAMSDLMSLRGSINGARTLFAEAIDDLSDRVSSLQDSLAGLSSLTDRIGSVQQAAATVRDLVGELVAGMQVTIAGDVDAAQRAAALLSGEAQ